jgi:hypothetical protein
MQFKEIIYAISQYFLDLCVAVRLKLYKIEHQNFKEEKHINFFYMNFFQLLFHVF